MRVVITLLCLAALSVAVFAASASEDFQTFWDETLVKVIALTPSTIVDLSVDFWSYVAPGGKWHPAKFIAWGGHYALETSLVVIIVYLLLQNAYKPSKADLPLTEEVSAVSLFGFYDLPCNSSPTGFFPWLLTKYRPVNLKPELLPSYRRLILCVRNGTPSPWLPKFPKTRAKLVILLMMQNPRHH